MRRVKEFFSFMYLFFCFELFGVFLYLCGRKMNLECGYGHPIPQGFSIIIVKPYVKAVTHGEKLEWWIILMVDCVTIFLHF